MPPSDPCPPAPVTTWGWVWRLAAGLLISTLSWWEISAGQWQDERALFWLDLVVGVACFGAFAFHRRWPFGVALLTGVAALVSASSAGAGALAFVSLATHRQVPRIAVVAVTSVLAGQLFYYYEPNPSQDPPWVNFTVITIATVALAAIGMYVGSRRELLWTLRERARQAEAEQALRVEQARSAERERIAREMHDVLAHRISLVAMHSGALAFRTDLAPEQVRETAELIQATSHEALADLRQVLGMLREEELEHRPQPTIGDVPTLVEEAAQGGLVVDFRSHLREAPPEQVGRTVYRVVQEGLTNARKHGAGSVRVRLVGRRGRGVAVVVSNPKPSGGVDRTPVSGLGLVGMRERVELSGGRLKVLDTATSFTLRGWLPWPT